EVLGSGVAAGLSGSVTFSFATAIAGVQDGTVDLGFFSHDTALTDLALAAMPILIFGTVDNYPTASLQALGGRTITGTAPTQVINLGTVLQNTGNLAATLDVINTAAGPADLLGGHFVVASAAGFTN